jgi:hypothetical protein
MDGAAETASIITAWRFFSRGDDAASRCSASIPASLV